MERRRQRKDELKFLTVSLIGGVYTAYQTNLEVIENRAQGYVRGKVAQYRHGCLMYL